MKRVQSSIGSFLTGPAQKTSNPTQHNSVCTVEEVEVKAPPQENSDIDRDYLNMLWNLNWLGFVLQSDWVSRWPYVRVIGPYPWSWNLIRHLPHRRCGRCRKLNISCILYILVCIKMFNCSKCNLIWPTVNLKRIRPIYCLFFHDKNKSKNQVEVHVWLKGRPRMIMINKHVFICLLF